MDNTQAMAERAADVADAMRDELDIRAQEVADSYECESCCDTGIGQGGPDSACPECGVNGNHQKNRERRADYLADRKEDR